MTRDPAIGIHVDLAVVSVGRLREAWPWLAELVEPGRRRHVQRDLSDAARARLDRLVLAERADRVQIARAGLKPAPPTAAPANLTVVDAMVTIQNIVEDTAWRVTDALRLQDGMAYRQVGRTGDQRVQAALDYLTMALPNVDDLGCVTDASIRLDTCDRLARNVAGVAEDRRHLATECPACGRRSLYAEVGSVNYKEWGILCGRDDCRCRGIDCGCRRPVRYPGARHLWPEREWEALALVLARRDAA